MEPFYKKFREAFRSSKYNQDEVLAKDLDVDPSYISTLRSDRRTPGRKIAATIATKLDLDYEQLLRSIEHQKAPDHLKKDFEKTEHLKVSVAANQGQRHTKIPLVAYVSAGKPFECTTSEFEKSICPLDFLPSKHTSIMQSESGATRCCLF